MDTVVFGTAFPLGMVLQHVFCSDQEFRKILIKGFSPTTAYSDSSQLFPGVRVHTDCTRRKNGTKRLGKDRGAEEKNFFYFSKSSKFILWVNSTERGRIKPLWTHRNRKGLNVIYSHKPRCDSHLHPGHFTLFLECKGVVKMASIIFTPTLWPFYTAKRALCVNENSSPREFNREEILSIDCARPSNRVYYWDITLRWIL